MNPLNEVLTVSEAAKLSGVTIQHIRRLCKSGVLAARYADGVWLILKASITKKENGI